MITTLPCDRGKHEDCSGEGLVDGILRPPHEPDAEGRRVWITVECGCSCHGKSHALNRSYDDVRKAIG